MEQDIQITGDLWESLENKDKGLTEGTGRGEELRKKEGTPQFVI